jgi:SWI/SNF-related matrix-associated actin-dependent regulator 1 of chromatin subfamily A
MKTYYIDKINKHVVLNFDEDNFISDQIKKCDFNARYNPELEHWICPINNWSKDKIKQVILTNGFKKRIINDKEDVVVDYSIKDVDLAYIKGLCDAMNFTYTPREYQLEALGYALNKGNILNGDDVGLGKTFEAIIYAEVTKSFPCLVVVPASVKYNWAEKWKEIVGDHRTIGVIDTETKKRKNNWNADVVIINYDIIGKKQGRGATVKHKELLEVKWLMSIFDEAHFLKNKSSQRARAAKMITKRDDIIVQLLTGTAIMSKPVEIWNLLILIKSEKKIAEDWYQFVRRYCNGYIGNFGWDTSGATNILELNQKLRDNCYIRREKRSVLKELPDVITEVIKLPVTNKRAILKAEDNIIEFLRETKGDESAEAAEEAEALVQLGVLRKLSIEGKLKAIDLYLKEWKQCEEKLLIFGLHREPLDFLSEKYKSPLIAGGVNSKKKQQIVNDWKTSDDQFMFANIQSAGTGVDGLQEICSNMIIIELPWRPSDLWQVIGRLDRSGQKFSPNIKYLLSDDSIDVEMWDMLSGKEEVITAVNKGQNIKNSKHGMKAVMDKLKNKKNKAK